MLHRYYFYTLVIVHKRRTKLFKFPFDGQNGTWDRTGRGTERDVGQNGTWDRTGRGTGWNGTGRVFGRSAELWIQHSYGEELRVNFATCKIGNLDTSPPDYCSVISAVCDSIFPGQRRVPLLVHEYVCMHIHTTFFVKSFV
jgi:hypothetical protein